MPQLINEEAVADEFSADRRKYATLQCLISVSEVSLRIDGVVVPTTRFAGSVLAWIAGAVRWRIYVGRH